MAQVPDVLCPFYSDSLSFFRRQQYDSTRGLDEVTLFLLVLMYQLRTISQPQYIFTLFLRNSTLSSVASYQERACPRVEL